MLNQSYQKWELLITDDSSSDNTLELIERIKDTRIKTWKLKENLGAAIARNYSMSKAKGEYIAFLDSDDEWESRKLSDQLDFMINKRIDFSFTAYNRLKQDLEKKKKIQIEPKTNFKQLLKNTQIYTSTVVVRRKAFSKFDMPNIRRRQDFAFWLLLLKQTPYAFGLNKAYTNYYETPNSLSSNYIKSITSTYMVYKKQLRYSNVKSLYLLFNYIFNAIKKRII